MSKPGHEQPELDNRAFPEDSLFSPPEIAPATTTGEPPVLTTEQTEPIRPVAEILAEHERRIEERGKRWEELTSANWPPGRIEEKLAEEFPDLKTAETIEREEVGKIAAHQHSSRLHEPKPKRGPTRFVSPRDTGPPPHEAEELRRNQGLKN